MRILRDVVGDDPDSSELLTAALKRANKRVAVKRPARAGSLDDREPSFVIKAKSSRYDIYLVS
jgi:16S rRNA (guanine1516-N2)-methyltransferase